MIYFVRVADTETWVKTTLKDVKYLQSLYVNVILDKHKDMGVCYVSVKRQIKA